MDPISLFIIAWFITINTLLVAAMEFRVPDQQLAFGIMIYQKPHLSDQQVLEDFHKLMEDIYTLHNHLYVIHVDIKSSTSLVNR